MLTLILICLWTTSLSQTTDQRYQNVEGFQIFAINSLFHKYLSEKQKVTITLTYEDGEIPILLICSNQPQVNKMTDYDSIQKENCQIDINAYDQKVQIQSISLTKNLKSWTFQTNFNIYYITSQNLFIGAYSKLQSTFSMSAKIQSLYNCAKECKNGGNCFYGLCECLEGTFGDDCSITGFDIKDQLKLQPDKLYYLTLYKTGTTFQKILSNQIPIRYQCYVETPFINQGSLMNINTLQLTYDQIYYCRNLTQVLQDESQIKLNPYFIFKIYSENEVSILENNSNSDGIQKIMMMIFIPLFVLIFFLIVCCGVKFYKKKLDQIQIVRKIEYAEKNFIDLYIPTHKFIQIKETIQEEINEKDLHCSICLEIFTLQNDVKVTYCKHIYHSECLILWLKKIKICPLCRAPLDEKTLAALIPQRSQTLIDQISIKSQPDNNKLKILSQNSLSSLNGQNTQQAFQNLNYQRSLVFIEQ